MAISGSGVKKDAFANYGTNAANAAGALDTINPIYSKLATGTVGYTPQQKADQLTASGQSLGGGVAAAVGQGGLEAARTGNAGGSAAALDDAAHNAATVQSSNALDVQNRSDDLATQNQRVGLGGLSSIYSGANQQADASLNTANNVQPGFLKTLANTALGDLRFSPGKK